MQTDPFYFFVSPMSSPIENLCDYDARQGWPCEQPHAPLYATPSPFKVHALDFKAFEQPRYQKQENRPPRLFTTEGGGSVYPHDIPSGKHCSRSQWCWLDVAGRVHINVYYQDESQVNGLRIDLTIPRPSSPANLVAMAVACSNRHEPVFVHGFLLHITDGVVSCVDYHTVGEYTFATPHPIKKDPVDGMQKFTLIPKKSIVSRAVVPKEDLPASRLAKSAPFQDCCLGCAAGFGCTKIRARRSKMPRSSR